MEDETVQPPKWFQCANCSLREKYEYFGRDPPFLAKFELKENAYVIEDPFQPPKNGQVLILGTHCIKCGKSVCKDNQCSVFYDGTYCLQCAKANEESLPNVLREKLNKIVL